MGPNLLKNAFGKMKLSDDTKDAVWRRLEEADRGSADSLTILKRKQRSPKRVLIQRWCLASLSVFVIAAAVIHIQTGGSIAEALQKLWKTEDTSQEVVEHTVSYPFNGLDGAELIDCNEERVIFASTMGLILYDRKEKRVVGTIDLKEIECFYFDGDSPSTRFLPEGDHLTIYNHRENKDKQEASYHYDLSQCRFLKSGEARALKPDKTEPVSDSLEKRWLSYTKRSRRDTYESETFAQYDEELLKRETWNFSRHSISWKGTGGDRYLSVLAVTAVNNENKPSDKTEYRFLLCTKNVDTGQSTEESLALRAEMPDSSKERTLPAYEYKTRDPITRALADCAKNDPTLFCGTYYDVGISYETHYPEDTLILPVISIYEVKETKRYTKVYGSFSTLGLKQYGSMLCDTGLLSGTTGYGCAYLKKTPHGYTVEKIVHPRDGSYIIADMTAMCDGDEALSKRLYKRDSNKGHDIRQKEILRMIKEYVTANDLDIQYYKEDLESPVKLDF